MITRKTTIDQHQGNHPGTGIRITRLVEVVTEVRLDETDERYQQGVTTLHRARVALESLDACARARAERWLDAHLGDDIAERDKYRAAVAAATSEPTEEQIAAMVGACPWSLVALTKEGDQWYAREVARATFDDEPGSIAAEADDAAIAEIRAALPPGWVAEWTGNEGDVVIEWAPEVRS